METNGSNKMYFWLPDMWKKKISSLAGCGISWPLWKSNTHMAEPPPLLDSTAPIAATFTEVGAARASGESTRLLTCLVAEAFRIPSWAFSCCHLCAGSRFSWPLPLGPPPVPCSLLLAHFPKLGLLPHKAPWRNCIPRVTVLRVSEGFNDTENLPWCLTKNEILWGKTLWAN